MRRYEFMEKEDVPFVKDLDSWSIFRMDGKDPISGVYYFGVRGEIFGRGTCKVFPGTGRTVGVEKLVFDCR